MTRVLDMSSEELLARLRFILAENPCAGSYDAVGAEAMLNERQLQEQMKRGIAIIMHRDYLVRMVTFLEGQS